MTTRKTAILTSAVLATTATACTGDDAEPTEPTPDVHVGLLVRLEAKPEHAADVAALLRDGKQYVDAEPGTPYWFAIQLGPTTFGIMDAFATDTERQAHLAGQLAAALLAAAPTALASDPVIEPVEVIARKASAPSAMVADGLLVRIEAKPGYEADVQGLIEDGAAIVADEPGTAVWFGIKVGPSSFAIFDAFPDAGARDAHLHGALAQALVTNAPVVLAQDPSIEPVDVIAAKLP